jgi:hypothetical protein
MSFLVLPTLPKVEGHYGSGNQHQDDRHYDGVSVFREERNDLPSIPRGQIRQDHLSGDSTERERGQEFSWRILHGARREQKWHHGHRGWQSSRDGNSGEPPSSEDLANLVHFSTQEPVAQRFFPCFACQSVSEKTAGHRTCRRQQTVIKPHLFLARRQHNRSYVQDSWKWNEGANQKAEGNQAQAAEVKKPPPHISCYRRKQRCVEATGGPLVFPALKTSAQFRMQLGPNSPF